VRSLSCPGRVKRSGNESRDPEDTRSATSATYSTSCRPGSRLSLARWHAARGHTEARSRPGHERVAADAIGWPHHSFARRSRLLPISRCQTAQSSSSRSALLRPGCCLPLSIHPPTEGWAERRQAQFLSWLALARRDASHSGGTLASRRSTVAILGRGPRFHLRHCLRICAASSSQPGRSAWRAGSRTSRVRGYEPRPRDATPRSAFRTVSRRRPSMSEDG
jgi:hypothetical protein